MISDNLHAIEIVFWLAMIPFWMMVAYFGRNAMQKKVQLNLVTQQEVNYFTKNFRLIFCAICSFMAIFSIIGGDLGIRLGGFLGFICCSCFIAWLWLFGGIKHFVMFGPFYNMPLKNEKRVRVVATILALYLGLGNLRLSLFL